MKDPIKKEIDSLIAKRSNFTTIVIVVITGTIGLTLNFKLIYLPLILLGISIAVFFFYGILNIEEKIKCLLKELEK